MNVNPSRFDESNIVEAARAFALERHGTQKYGDDPYEVHLADVAKILSQFDPELEAVGWLHDVEEDTPTTTDEIKTEFGTSVADTVHAVSSEPGRNRRERNKATYPKIRANHRAVIAKLADRLANVRNASSSGSDLLLMYRREYPGFREALYYESSDIAHLWKELDEILL